MSDELVRLLDYFDMMYETGKHKGEIVLKEGGVTITLNIKMEED